MPKWSKILIALVAAIVVIIAAFLVYMNTTFISKNEAKEQLINHINVKEDDIYFETVELEMETSQYEVDFYYNNKEYKAKIDAKEGKVIYTNFTPDNTNDKNTIDDTTNKKETEITLDEAKSIALKQTNLKESDVTLIKANEEIDNGIKVYEIQYKDATYKYDFDISKTGEIIGYDKDPLNK